jgi:hypothetical protein
LIKYLLIKGILLINSWIKNNKQKLFTNAQVYNTYIKMIKRRNKPMKIYNLKKIFLIKFLKKKSSIIVNYYVYNN